MFKKLFTAILAFAMLVSSLPAGTIAYASDVTDNPSVKNSEANVTSGGGISLLADNSENEGYVKTPIKKLVYNVTANNIKEGTKFKVVYASWNTKETDIINKNDTQDLTVLFDSEVEGMINMGYAYDGKNDEDKEAITEDSAKIIINSITINDTYTITVNATLDKNSNGLTNIWSGQESGTTIYEGNDSRFIYEKADNEENGHIYFYAKSSNENPSGGEDNPQDTTKYEQTPINKLTYNITASNITKETKFKITDVTWYQQEVIVTNGEQDLSFSYSGTDGMKVMGYICDSVEDVLTDSNVAVVVNSVTVNDNYIIPINVTLNSTSKDLKNIWAGFNDGDKVYEGTNSYFAYDKTKDQISFYTEAKTINTNSNSMKYVKAMGNGWNLGNSLEAINTNLAEEDTIETAWGNPVVTKELIQSAKAKGFGNIRIPLTFYRRYTVNENAAANEYKYVINKNYLDRAKEVINWALDEGFYVMTNIHHDSWTWLEPDWDESKGLDSEKLRMYKDFWRQLADAFKNVDDKLCFETINEYNPGAQEEATDKMQQQVMDINKTAHDIIRDSGGNNATRMIVMPTYDHNSGDVRCSYLT